MQQKVSHLIDVHLSHTGLIFGRGLNIVVYPEVYNKKNSVQKFYTQKNFIQFLIQFFFNLLYMSIELFMYVSNALIKVYTLPTVGICGFRGCSCFQYFTRVAENDDQHSADDR